MHSAPSVSYPVGRSRNANHLVLAIWIAGAAVAGLMSARLSAIGWRQGVLALGVTLAGGLAWRGFGRCAAPAQLVFDGLHWSLSSGFPMRNARAHVALDLQSLLLVRMVEAGRMPRWIWLDRHAMPQRWRDLRRAVYSRPPFAGSDADLRRATPAGAHRPLS